MHNFLYLSDFNKLKQLIALNKTDFSATTVVNLESLLEKFQAHVSDSPSSSTTASTLKSTAADPHYKHYFCYGYDFDAFLERIDLILDNQEMTNSTLSWDFIDDLSNVFNYGYWIPWKNRAESGASPDIATNVWFSLRVPSNI
jgi:hypothetical protein